MNDRDQRRYNRAINVRTFGETNSADFAIGSKAKTLFVTLDDLIERLDNAKADQTPARVSKETLLDALLLDLKNISRTARDINKTENGFAACYRIPDSPSESAITTFADAVLKRLEDQEADSEATLAAKAALRAQFIAYDLPADFVEQLGAHRQAIDDANKLNQKENQDGVGNTELIGKLLGEVNDVISSLNAIMHNKYTRMPEKLRAWQSASHVERAPKHDKKTDPAPPPTPQ
jgi:hypothetical protein